MNNNLIFCYCLGAVLSNRHDAIIANINVNDEEFYIDFDCEKKFSESDFNSLEKDLKKFIQNKPTFEFDTINKNKFDSFNKYLDSVIKAEKKKNVEIIKNKNFAFVNYANKEEFNDANKLMFFHLKNISGAYWENNIKNKQLQRISGYAFDNANDFELYTKLLKERQERDHRKIGQDLELFAFNPLIGQGLPIWLPNGTIIKTQIENFVHDVLERHDYSFVQTPVLGMKQLYEVSGHWDHYRENMFPTLKIDEDVMVLRPMTCPHHMIVYKMKPHSYKELPYRFAEHAILHRYEASGSLIGFERVRSMQLVDTHVIIRPDQIFDEVKHCFETIKEAIAGLNIKFDSIDLSLHDPKNKQKFFDNEKMWQEAEEKLEDVCKHLGLNVTKKVGEAAFYGPKIDFQFKTALGHIITVSTIQLDFLLPERFNLEYIDYERKAQRPILIHGGIIGTFERFLSILLEQTKGVLPLWLVPNQIIIIPIADKHLEFCHELRNKLRNYKIRVKVDETNERLSKKIRNAQISKIPYQIVIGDNEIKSNNISYREYGKEEVCECSFEDFIKYLNKRIASKK